MEDVRSRAKAGLAVLDEAREIDVEDLSHWYAVNANIIDLLTAGIENGKVENLHVSNRAILVNTLNNTVSNQQQVDVHSILSSEAIAERKVLYLAEHHYDKLKDLGITFDVDIPCSSNHHSTTSAIDRTNPATVTEKKFTLDFCLTWPSSRIGLCGTGPESHYDGYFSGNEPIDTLFHAAKRVFRILTDDGGPELRLFWSCPTVDNDKWRPCTRDAVRFKELGFDWKLPRVAIHIVLDESLQEYSVVVESYLSTPERQEDSVEREISSPTITPYHTSTSDLSEPSSDNPSDCHGETGSGCNDIEGATNIKALFGPSRNKRKISPSERFPISVHVGVHALSQGSYKGLHNLGNTCFMNSALQCLTHIVPLVHYFLSRKFQADLNPSNPLGMGGRLASAFYSLIQQLYRPDDGGRDDHPVVDYASTVAPRTLKSVIGQFAPQFLGYQQQDSQEFTAFMLDGLHEDLNRVQQKSYVPAVEGDDLSDSRQLAETAWEKYKTRDDSFIVDTFQGQYRSRLECPDCGKVSIVFDPFMYLSLPIPSNIKYPFRVVFYLPSQFGSYALELGVLLDNSASLDDVKDTIADNLIMALSKDAAPRFNEVFQRVFGYDAPSQKKQLVEYMALQYGRPEDLLSMYSRSTLCGSEFTTERAESGSNYLIPALMAHLIDPEHLAGFDRDQHLLIQLAFLVDNIVEYAPVFRLSSTATCAEVHALAVRINPFGSLENLATRPFFAQPGNNIQWNDTTPLQDLLPRSFSNAVAMTIASLQPVVLVATVPENEEAIARHILPSAKEVERQFKNPQLPAVPIEACLAEFQHEEELGPENMWYCDRCKTHRQARKRIDLWRLPPVLVIHFKRFKQSRCSRDGKSPSFRSKDQTEVVFGSVIDLSTHINPTAREDGAVLAYEVIGVSHHVGSLSSGHYFASVRVPKITPDGEVSRRWYSFNDSSVTELTDKIDRRSAYMLFLQRKDAVELETSLLQQAACTEPDDT